jgi:hypothetical protein
MKTMPIGIAGMWWLGMRCALRRFGFHRNAMRRPLDRRQSIIGLGLFLVFLALGPIVGSRVVQHAYASGVGTEQRQSATRHRVDATVVRRAGSGSGFSAVVGHWDLVRWQSPDGSGRSGVAYSNEQVGAHVPLWVNDSGATTGAPQTRSQTVGTAGFAGAGAMAAVAGPLVLGYALIRRRFDRRRLAAWGDEWALISPRWTERT